MSDRIAEYRRGNRRRAAEAAAELRGLRRRGPAHLRRVRRPRGGDRLRRWRSLLPGIGRPAGSGRS